VSGGTSPRSMPRWMRAAIAVWPSWRWRAIMSRTEFNDGGRCVPASEIMQPLGRPSLVNSRAAAKSTL